MFTMKVLEDVQVEFRATRAAYVTFELTDKRETFSHWQSFFLKCSYCNDTNLGAEDTDDGYSTGDIFYLKDVELCQIK